MTMTAAPTGLITETATVEICTNTLNGHDEIRVHARNTGLWINLMQHISKTPDHLSPYQYALEQFYNRTIGYREVSVEGTKVTYEVTYVK